MNYHCKKSYSYSVFVVLMINVWLITHYVAPTNHIDLTSTRLTSLKRVMDFQAELNHLGDQLKELETLQPKWMELYRNHRGQIMSKVDTLRSALEEYIQDYNSEFDINKLKGFRNQISKIKVELKSSGSGELPDFPSIASLVGPVFSATNDSAMWEFKNDITILNMAGIKLDEVASDSTLNMDNAHIQVFNLIIELIQLLESYQILKDQAVEDMKGADPTFNNIKRLEEMGMEQDMSDEHIESWLHEMIDPPLNQRKKIDEFMEEHGVVLGQLVDRVENKRNEVIGLLDKLVEMESAHHVERDQAEEMNVEILKTFKDLTQEFTRRQIIKFRRYCRTKIKMNCDIIA